MRRQMIVATIGAVVLAAAVGSGEARAQAASPTAEALLDGHVKASGGQAAFGKMTTRVTKIRLEIPAAGITMSVSTWAARPDRIRNLIESELLGRVESGFDGTVAWELATTSGPRLLDGPQLDDAVRDSRFDGLAGWQEWVAKSEVQGTADVEGKPAWRVLVTPKRGSAQTLYFDQSSSLVVKMDSIVRTPAGDIPTERYVSDYRDVGGVRLPHRVRIVVAGQERIMVVESIAHNVEIPAGQFDPPKEINALLAKK